MAEITIVKPNDEGKSALEVTVNGEKWSITRGETVDVPEYIATEVRRSLAQRDRLSLSDRDEREGEPESGGSGGGGGESSNVETATIVITVTDGTPEITSGAFPDWCTEANTNYIYGRAKWNDIETAFLWVFGMEGTQIVNFIEIGNGYGVATDLSLIASGTNEPTPLTGDWIINITLIYMPEE